MSYLAPAGTRLSIPDVLLGVGSGARSSQIETLQHGLAAWSGARACHLIASGRAAMTTALRAMSELPANRGRDQVIVAGYTCYSVPAAVVRAGLKPRLCDIDPATLSLDLTRLASFDFRRVLAIVSANLYGIPNALPQIEEMARRNAVMMLDDAAQSLGARVAGRPVGGYGDAGIYSFDKGKNITTIQGGALVTGAQLASVIGQQMRSLPAQAALETAGLIARLMVYTVLLRPSLYGLVHRAKFLGLGRTEFETRYPITHLSKWLAGVAARQYRRIGALNATRIANAQRLHAALQSLDPIRLPQLVPAAEPVFARFPLFVRDPNRRAAVIAALDAAGIGATASYPNALADVPEVAALVPPADLDTPGARAVAKTIVTLPTHGYCPTDLAQRVSSIIRHSAA